jgi:5'-nucleotidase
VIASSDFHAALEPIVEANNQRMGGAVALSAAIRRAQRECLAPACHSIVVDGGDLFSGTPASDWDGGRPTAAIMNRLGVTAGVLGNHEFDAGQDTLRARLRELGYPVLAANVRGPDGRLPSWLRADTIVTRGNVRIGLVGAAGTHTPQTASRRKVGALTFVDPVPVLRDRARALRAAGAQVVVAAIHDGGRCAAGYSGECSGSGIEIARRLAASGTDRPDALVMGHSHTNVALDFGGMPAVQAASSGRSVLIIDMPLDGGAARTEVRPIRGDQVEDAAPGVDSIVTAALTRAEQRMRQPVATIAEPMLRDGAQNPVGNMLADAMRRAARADVGMWNNGGIRANVQAGPLNYGGVHYVAPFGNTIAVVRLRGRDLLAMFEQAVQGSRPNIHISGFTVEYDGARPRGARVMRATDTRGQPVDTARIYTVAMNDFMAENDFGAIVGAAISTQFLNTLDIDAVSEFLRNQPQPVRGDATARIRAIPPGSN